MLVVPLRGWYTAANSCCPREVSNEPSVGTSGDSYDNALAETINGLYKTGVIHLQS